MATTAQLQIAALPTAEEVALTLLQWLFATIGVPTDYNIGSIIRTYSEGIGASEEIEGITTQAQAVQALVYSAYAAFGISPLQATGAVGSVNFSTLSASPLPSGVSVIIPNNTVVSTVNGIQFSTTSSVTLVSGTSIIAAPIQAVTTGITSNVAANTITQIITGLSYPLTVTNPLPTAGGSVAETASQTLARFMAKVQSLGLCSPIAVASAVIGVTFGQEEVLYSTCYEGWIAQVQAMQTPTAGFQVYIDNGTGTASSNLITAVTNYLSTGGTAGFRPAGVPFTVAAVNPVSGSVQVVASAINPALDGSIQAAIQQSILAYFASLGFGITAQKTQLVATIANVSIGQLTSLAVTLLNGASVSVDTIAAGPTQRVILTGSSVTVS